MGISISPAAAAGVPATPASAPHAPSAGASSAADGNKAVTTHKARDANQAQAARDKSTTPAELSQAVTDINAALHRFATTLQFTVDPTHSTPVVKVVDKSSGQTIRQMPSEDAIQAAHMLDQAKGLLFGQKA